MKIMPLWSLVVSLSEECGCGNPTFPSCICVLCTNQLTFSFSLPLFFIILDDHFNRVALYEAIVHAILTRMRRIMYDVAVPAVATAAVPTTEEIATTNEVNTNSMARPCIQVVAVVEPEMVLGSMVNVAEVAPVYIATEPADSKLIS